VFSQPLFWLYLFGLFQIYIYLNNRITFHPRLGFKEWHWTVFWGPAFFLLLSIPSWGLLSAWDFALAGWMGLALPWKVWTCLVGLWTLWLWVVHSRWNLLLRRPASFRLLKSYRPVLSKDLKAPFGFLKWVGFQNQIYRPEVNEYEVFLPGWPKEFSGFTLVQVSDVHHGKFISRRYLEAVVREAQKLRPDVFALTGDFISLKKDILGLKGLFKGLKARHGTYALMGNHDYWADGDAVLKVLESDGVQVLRNKAVYLKKKGKKLALIGTDDYWMGKVDEGAVLKVKADAKVLLAHNPDQFTLAKKAGIPLQVSGHCHGGQVCFPFIGPLIVPSAHGRKYASGFIREKDSTLFISRGIGCFPPLRTFCPPEIVKLVLRPAKS
jgi:uncharacterized protein